MFELGLSKLHEKKLALLGFFLFFLAMYTIVDSLNMSYTKMAEIYSISLVIINIVINVIMSALTSLMLTLSIINIELKGSETKSQNFGFLSILFGVLTYGCTSCVIGFFAAIGISYSVVALPLAGLPYKFISLGLIILGLWLTKYEMNKPCKLK